MPETTLGKLAARLDAVLENGDPGKRIAGVNSLLKAGPDEVAFLANSVYRPQLAETGAGAVIVHKTEDVGGVTAALLRVDRPNYAFALAEELLTPAPNMPGPGVHPTAVVSPGATLGSGVSVGPWTVVEDGAAIGDGTILYPNVYVGEGTGVGANCVFHPGVFVDRKVTVGSRCVFYAGVTVGSDGFGYAWTGSGYHKIRHSGTVEIGDDVELGCNACVHRGRFGATRIGKGTKIDALVVVAHNVRIGEHSVLAAQSGIAGSAEIGDNVKMGGQTGVAGHIRVGSNLVFGGQAGITKSIPDAGAGRSEYERLWIGYPAAPYREQARNIKDVRLIGALRRKVRDLEERMRRLEEKEEHGG
ncbi:MAG: UDP-3-O-(3-hydroxymyristoyl)glucosamine N-acyltransferase [Planctomycetota bacterium]|jgi:UDP-3-O-[3-hydroxymyristoyl] glucosamine N-acyltransferase|nr:UDP-3-O-(3-hydroxymyristoyl)glucosamine N-acyltransferase [Planctomycetota bacterium]